MKRLVWVASYPKSGNTWFRVLLTNYLRNQDMPTDINDLEATWVAAYRALVDNALPVACSDLTADEIAEYRAHAYRNIAQRSTETRYFKVHDACTDAADGSSLFPVEATRGAIYLVRNPLDISSSFAHHYGSTVDDAIERMGDRHFILTPSSRRLDRQLPQRLLTWSEHVTSWIDGARFPVHRIRYEDLLREPVEIFKGALRFLGIADDIDRVRKAVAFSSFQRLREQEATRGFKEKPPVANRFFREGREGGWTTALTGAQRERIVADHGDVMRRLGYLP